MDLCKYRWPDVKVYVVEPLGRVLSDDITTNRYCEGATFVSKQLGNLIGEDMVIRLPEKLRYPTTKLFKQESAGLVHINKTGCSVLAVAYKRRVLGNFPQVRSPRFVQQYATNPHTHTATSTPQGPHTAAQVPAAASHMPNEATRPSEMPRADPREKINSPEVLDANLSVPDTASRIANTAPKMPSTASHMVSTAPQIPSAAPLMPYAASQISTAPLIPSSALQMTNSASQMPNTAPQMISTSPQTLQTTSHLPYPPHVLQLAPQMQSPSNYIIPRLVNNQSPWHSPRTNWFIYPPHSMNYMNQMPMYGFNDYVPPITCM